MISQHELDDLLSCMDGCSPLPWEAFAEKIIVAEPERVRVVIRAANGYRVAVEDNPNRWEQALKDFEFICRVVNSQNVTK